MCRRVYRKGRREGWRRRRRNALANLQALWFDRSGRVKMCPEVEQLSRRTSVFAPVGLLVNEYGTILRLTFKCTLFR